MEEWDPGKEQFLKMVKTIDASIEVVVPTAPSNGMFLISLTKGPNRKFLTVSEDDMIDLSSESDIVESVNKTLTDAVEALS